MLDHKWEGVQTVAAHVLGAWGGTESVAALRGWLARLLERPYGWAVRGVAAQALAMCVTEEDIAWVLDLYFELPTPMLQHELLPVLAALPTAQTLTYLRVESRRDRSRRDAATRALRRIASSAESPRSASDG